MTGRALVAAAVVLLCGACGSGEPTGEHPSTTPPSSFRSTEPVVDPAAPVGAADLCASHEGLSFWDSAMSGAPGAASARRAGRPWLAAGERLGTASGRPGRSLVLLSRRGRVREVLTVVRQRSTGRWFVERATGCLTHRPPSRPCADAVVFRGAVYHRPTYDIPGPTDQIGVGRVFGQGTVPACADVTAYAGAGRHLVGAVAPVTVYQQEEVPMSDSVVTSPATELGPRIYDSR